LNRRDSFQYPLEGYAEATEKNKTEMLEFRNSG
jgi:hypothetical protein